ncbi:hypothetical protein KCU67_g14293, partial [Aureobasidium melanogenum]
TAAGIPTWSPTVVLICRSTAYVWQSGRDAQFSADCGQVWQKLYDRRAVSIGILASEIFSIGWTSMKQFAILCNPVYHAASQRKLPYHHTAYQAFSRYTERDIVEILSQAAPLL